MFRTVGRRGRTPVRMRGFTPTITPDAPGRDTPVQAHVDSAGPLGHAPDRNSAGSGA